MNKFKLSVLVLSVALLFGLTAPAFAEDPVVIADSVFDKVDEAMGRAEKAREVYDRAKDMGKPAEEVRKAEEDLNKAEGDLRQANVKLDTARENAIAEAAGVSPEKVRAMRASGMGWGNIANELGVHPSVVSKGAKKSKHMKGKKSYDDDTDDDGSKGKNKSKTKSKDKSNGKSGKDSGGKKK